MSKIDKLTPDLVKRIIKEEKAKIEVEKRQRLIEEKRKLLEVVRLYKETLKEQKNHERMLKVFKKYIQRRT